MIKIIVFTAKKKIIGINYVIFGSIFFYFLGSVVNKILKNSNFIIIV